RVVVCRPPPSKPIRPSPTPPDEASATVAAEDRTAVRRPRPHHRDARRSEDPVPDGRATLYLSYQAALTRHPDETSAVRCGRLVQDGHQASPKRHLTSSPIGSLGARNGLVRCRRGALGVATG